MRLATQLALWMAASLIVVGIILMLLVGHTLNSTFESEIEKRSILVAQAVAELVITNVIENEAVTVRNQLQEVVRRTEDVRFAYITGFDGQIFAHTFTNGFPRDLIPSADQETIRADRPLLQHRIASDGELLLAGFPLIDSLKATIHIGMSEAGLHQKIDEVQTQMLGITLLMVLLFIAFAFILSRSITRPLERLSRSLLAFGQAQGERKLAYRGGGREVADLTHAFNQMIAQRTQAESQRRESEQMLQQVLDTIPVRVAWKDEHSVYQGGNRAFVEDAGLSSSAEIVGKTDADLPWGEMADWRRGTHDVITARLPALNNVSPLKIANNTHIWHRASKFPLRNVAGNSAHVLVIYEDVTEQVRMDEALRQSEQMLRQVLDTIPVRVAWKDEHSVYQGGNRAFAEDAGLASPDDIVGKTDADLPWGAAENWQRGTHAMIESSVPTLKAVTPLTRAGDVQIWIRASKFPMPNIEGDISGVLVTYEDVTELIQAGDALRESEQMLRQVLDTIPVRVFWKDRDSVYQGCNRAFAEDAGIASPAGIVGKTDADLPWSNDADWLQQADREVIATQIPILNDIRALKRASDTQLWHQANKFPLRNTDGQVIGVLAAYEDISKLIEVQEALRESEQMLRQVLDAIPTRIFWKDTNSVYQGCNRAFADDMGLSSPEVIIGKSDDDLSWKEDADRFREGDRRMIERQIPVLNDIRPMTRADHSQIWHRASKFPLIDVGSDVIGVLATYEDVTELVEATEEIRILNAELEQRVIERTAQLEAANQELESFSYSISHDLRAPLRSINGFSHAVLEDYGTQLPEDGQEYLQRVVNSAQRMGHLIDDLLTFSRLTRHALRKQTIDLASIINQTIDELQTDLDNRQVDFEIGDLPPCEADPALLRQVFANLLGNAVKYTRLQDHARIEIGSQIENGATVYYVQDNGAGFDMRYADKLFGVFQRLHRAEEYEGTGIGLATVQRIIHRHGGHIWAEAEVDQGATFFFTLGESD